MARMEVDNYIENNEDIDLRTAPPAVKLGMIHDQEVLDMRWNLCLGCEHLNEINRCVKCGCFMKTAHKFSWKYCPIGKWNKYKEPHGITATG